jgi:endonuclease-3
MARKTPKQKKPQQRLKAARQRKAARLNGRKAQAKADAKAVHGELPQWTKAEIEEAFRRFAAANPAPRGELQHINPFTLLVAVVLSAQATDAGVNKATPALFALADTPEQMAKLGEARVRDLIKTIGLFRTKAKNVIGLSRQLIDKHGGKVPHDREALEALPGVGRKTANVVLNIAFGEPTIAVDTHIFRVGNRTGLAVGKTPLDVEMKLLEVVPDRYRLHAHHWLILHGRYTCIARRPLCEKCIIADLCKWPGKTTLSAPTERPNAGVANPNCSMDLPPLYKYLDVRGAKLTLDNGTFKHSKPSDFNDVEDLTVKSIFPEETEAALKKLEENFHDVFLQHLDDPPTCDSPLREQIALVQNVYRNNPKAAEVVKAELSKEGAKPIYNVEYMRELAKESLREINEFMQDYRIFCVTTQNDSDKMWSTYAQSHKGIVLRIEPNIAKDSKFRRFHPVEYRKERPPIYDDTLDLITDLFGDRQARLKASLEKIVYSKTLPWQHEAEYRLAISLGQREPSWDILKFHPEEITELYLGLAITKEDKEEIVSKAKALNPKIVIFQASRDASGKLTFRRI